MDDRRPGITLVVAMAENRVIGRDQTLPWRLPDDLRRFRALTLGKPVLMGRRTWSSLGRPLPGRTNVVLTRDPHFASSPGAQGAVAVHSLAEALDRCAQAPEIAVIGGAELYRLALPLADRIEMTRVHAEICGDTWFPELLPAEWRVTLSVRHEADARHEWAMSFETLERCDPGRRHAFG